MLHFFIADAAEGSGAATFWGSCLKDGVATLACLPNLYSRIINFALFFAGFTALVFIIIGGIRFILSGGDAKQTESAKKTITYALIGLILVLLSFAIVSLISYLTGAECIQTFGFDSCK